MQITSSTKLLVLLSGLLTSIGETIAAPNPNPSVQAAATQINSAEARAITAPPGLQIHIPIASHLDSDDDVPGKAVYGGSGPNKWEFKFFEPASYTAETFRVPFHEEAQTTAAQIVECTASVTVSPTAIASATIVSTGSFVSGTPPAPYGVICTSAA